MTEISRAKRDDSKEVTFNAPAALVDKLDRLAESELMTRSTLLRRLAAKAVAERAA